MTVHIAGRVSKKAWLALCVAVFIPLLFYMIASKFGVNMPRHYYPDSVVTKIKDGKEITDTV